MTTSTQRDDRIGRLVSSSRRIWTILACSLVWTILAALVVFHIANIMRGVNWIPGDDYIFTRSTASGNWIGFGEQIRTHDARFFPLAFQEFNLLKGAGNAPELYYLLNVGKYLLVLGILAAALVSIGRAQWADGLGRSGRTSPSRWGLASVAAGILAVVYLLHPRLHLVFGHIIYPESMQMVWVALFALLGYRQVRRGGLGNYIASFLCGTMVLYYKEPAFALILPAAVVPLLVRRRSMKPAQLIWSAAMIVSVLVWLCLYLFLVYARKTGANYASIYANSGGHVEAFARLFLDPTSIYLPMAILGVYRAGSIARAVWRGRGERLSMELLFMDSLLLGGLLYIAAFATLKMADLRFLPPSNVLFTVVCFYYACRLIRSRAWPIYPRSEAKLTLAAVLAMFWLSARLGCQTLGFRMLHDRQHTWAPSLQVVSEHSEYPVVYVCPAGGTTARKASHDYPLRHMSVCAEQTVIRLQMPEGASPVRCYYLDMDGELGDRDALVDSRVEVIRELPPGGEYFLFVPPDATDFPEAMARRFGIEVVKLSGHAFKDDTVREIWAPRDLARRVGVMRQASRATRDRTDPNDDA